MPVEIGCDVGTHTELVPLRETNLWVGIQQIHSEVCHLQPVLVLQVHDGILTVDKELDQLGQGAGDPGTHIVAHDGRPRVLGIIRAIRVQAGQRAHQPHNRVDQPNDGHDDLPHNGNEPNREHDHADDDARDHGSQLPVELQ